MLSRERAVGPPDAVAPSADDASLNQWADRVFQTYMIRQNIEQGVLGDHAAGKVGISIASESKKVGGGHTVRFRCRQVDWHIGASSICHLLECDLHTAPCRFSYVICKAEPRDLGETTIPAWHRGNTVLEHCL